MDMEIFGDLEQVLNEITFNILIVKNNYGDKQVIALFEKNILKVKNPKLCCWFAQNVKGADIKAHEQVVLDSKKPKLSYYFARDVKGADIKAHEKVVLESKDTYLKYLFARDVKDADIKLHEQAILNSKNQKLSYYFARYVEGADIFAHRDIVINGDIEYWKEEFEKFLNERCIKQIDDTNQKILSLESSNNSSILKEQILELTNEYF